MSRLRESSAAQRVGESLAAEDEYQGEGGSLTWPARRVPTGAWQRAAKGRVLALRLRGSDVQQGATRRRGVCLHRGAPHAAPNGGLHEQLLED